MENKGPHIDQSNCRIYAVMHFIISSIYIMFAAMPFIISRCMKHGTYVGNNNINKYNTVYIFVRLCAGRNSSLPVGFYRYV